MSSTGNEHLTRLLNEASAGSLTAAQKLLPLVYDSLKGIARQRMTSERQDHTLQATALVHECYLRLFGDTPLHFQARAQFFHAASEAMRRILIDYARSRGSIKRGDPRRRLPLSVLDLAAQPEPQDILCFDAALKQLEAQSPTTAAIVKLRFFAGLPVQDVADALGVSTRTVNREWNYARAYLYSALEADFSD